MITLSLASILIPYAVVVAFFLIFALVNIYHMIHFGETTKVSFLVTFAFYAVSVLILFFTWQALQGTDWQQAISLDIFNQQL